jgi:predicted nicotinamide N-methyase
MPFSAEIATPVGAPGLAQEEVPLPGGDVRLLRPADSEALLTEEAFEREELLPYWAELWSSSSALARAVAVRSLKGIRTLELGCGLGLVSIAAARSGARVTATDWSSAAIALAARNAKLNGVELETLCCSWQQPGPVVERAPWSLVLASDVLYDRANIGLLVGLLARLTDQRSEVLIADPGRPPADKFLERAREHWRVDTRFDAGPAEVRLHLLTARDT